MPMPSWRARAVLSRQHAAGRHALLLGDEGVRAVPRNEYCTSLRTEDAGNRAKFLIRDRDSKFTGAFDALMINAGLKGVTTGIRIPRLNSLTERWIQTCRTVLLDRTPGPDPDLEPEPPPPRLREYESFYNEHRPHRALEQAGSLPPATHPHHATSPARPPGSPQTRPARRNPPRIPTSGLNCADDVSAPTVTIRWLREYGVGAARVRRAALGPARWVSGRAPVGAAPSTRCVTSRMRRPYSWCRREAVRPGPVL